MICIGNNIYIKKERISCFFEATRSRQWERLRKDFLGLSYGSKNIRSIIVLTDGSIWGSSVSSRTLRLHCKNAGLHCVPLSKFSVVIAENIQQYLPKSETKLYQYLVSKFNKYIVKGKTPSTLILMPEFCVLSAYNPQKITKLIKAAYSDPEKNKKEEE